MMSPTNLKDLVTDYYAGKSLPEEAVQRLERLTARGARRRNGRVWLIAASIPLVAFAAGYATPWLTRTAPPEPTASAGELLPDLVAVNIRADWCRRSTEVAPIFTEFAEKHSNQPILFVTMDITDDASRNQADYLASTLGIDDVLDAPFASGMIKVFDRSQGRTVATLTGTEQVQAMEGLLAQLRSP